uniref:F-box domain-containing protein n=1 Tax=Rhinopithecus bieti TaxID=61621 RepID=A0A2K6KA87_RHIBE
MDEGGTPLLPDSLVYQIFLSLGPADVLAAGLVCRQWQAVSRDEFLWREQFYRYYQVARDVPRHPAATSWYEEFQRLYDTVPCVEVQTLREHTDQVLHLSFSHSGYQFASCSKDCTVKVRMAQVPCTSHPAAPKHGGPRTQAFQPGGKGESGQR